MEVGVIGVGAQRRLSSAGRLEGTEEGGAALPRSGGAATTEKRAFGLEYKWPVNLARQQKFICRVCIAFTGPRKELPDQCIHQLPAVADRANAASLLPEEVSSSSTASQQVSCSNHLLLNASDSLLNPSQQIHICTFSVGGPDNACSDR